MHRANGGGCGRPAAWSTLHRVPETPSSPGFRPARSRHGRATLRRTLVAGLAVLTFVTAPVPVTPAQDTGDEVRLASDVVVVPFTARDARGRLIDGMTEADVSVTVGGEAPDLAFFERDAAPVDALLLLDSSASTGATLGTITASALAFVRQLGKADSYAVMTFADKPEVVVTWTSDAARARTTLATVQSSGNTYLNLSAQVAIRSMFEDRPAGRRRALVILTDGLDLRSGYYTPQRTADEALRRDVAIYVVSVNRLADEAVKRMFARDEIDPSLRADYEEMQVALRAAEGTLVQLAESTGGRVVFPARDVDLGTAFAEIAAEIRSRYVLGFYAPQNTKNGFHPISVKARSSGVTIRARSGYFTGPYVEMVKP